MTDNWQRFTNKMLYHAQVQLETWKKTEGPAESVFREACIHNMVFTYQSLLAEILAVYQIPVKKLPDLNDALALLYQKHEISSELAYIQQLEKKPGWLLALKKAYSESLSPSASLSMKQSHELSLKKYG